ncbi:hypothetical protein ACFS07_12700 [Undibacterium arcticum]
MRETKRRRLTALPKANVGRAASQAGRINAFDPFGIGKAFATVQLAWLAHPKELTDASIRLSSALQGWVFHSWNRTMGLENEAWVPVLGQDERFLDPEWERNSGFSAWRQCYLFYTHWLEQTLYDTPGVSKTERRTAAFFGPGNGLTPLLRAISC